MSNPPLIVCLVFSASLFSIGTAGIFLNRKNILLILLCFELQLLAVNTNFIVFAQHCANLSGQLMVLFIVIVAAIKIAIGLAILMLMMKKQHAMSTDELHLLRH